MREKEDRWNRITPCPPIPLRLAWFRILIRSSFCDHRPRAGGRFERDRTPTDWFLQPQSRLTGLETLTRPMCRPETPPAVGPWKSAAKQIFRGTETNADWHPGSEQKSPRPVFRHRRQVPNV